MQSKILDKNFICIQNMQMGRTYGIRRIFHKNGIQKSEAKFEYGVCLTLKEWDEDGVLIKEKLETTEEEIELRDSQEKLYKHALDKE